MKAALIIIGDEILSGKTHDINTLWLGKFLMKKGVDLVGTHTIKDDQQALFNSLNYFKDQVDLIFTSGGIGPTKDDKTKWVLAEYFKKQVKFNEDSFKIVSDNYQRFGREYEKGKNAYADTPEDFIITTNERGLAPGLIYKSDEIMTLSAPGVPHELSHMIEDTFWPIIKESVTTPLNENMQLTVRSFGVPEEEIFLKQNPKLWEQLEEHGKVSSLPHLMGVDIVVSAHDNNIDKDQFEKSIKDIIAATTIKDKIWQYGSKDLPLFVMDLLNEKNKTVSFAESCTGGLSASRLTDLSGSSNVFLGGVVSYANEVKMGTLGVKEQTLIDHGAVSEQTALEMAEGVLKLTGSDFAISYTGIAGPGGGSPEKPVGTVAIGWATKDSSGSNVYQYKGDRKKLKMRFSEKGYFKLLELIKASN